MKKLIIFCVNKYGVMWRGQICGGNVHISRCSVCNKYATHFWIRVEYGVQKYTRYHFIKYTLLNLLFIRGFVWNEVHREGFFLCVFLFIREGRDRGVSYIRGIMKKNTHKGQTHTHTHRAPYSVSSVSSL